METLHGETIRNRLKLISEEYSDIDNDIFQIIINIEITCAFIDRDTDRIKQLGEYWKKVFHPKESIWINDIPTLHVILSMFSNNEYNINILRLLVTHPLWNKLCDKEDYIDINDNKPAFLLEHTVCDILVCDYDLEYFKDNEASHEVLACPICYTNQKSVILNCGHTLCRSCCFEIIRSARANKCPECRCEIDTIKRVYI